MVCLPSIAKCRAKYNFRSSFLLSAKSLYCHTASYSRFAHSLTRTARETMRARDTAVVTMTVRDEGGPGVRGFVQASFRETSMAVRVVRDNGRWRIALPPRPQPNGTDRDRG